MRDRIADAIEAGTPAEQKLVKARVAEVTVTSRDHVEPYFRVPNDGAAGAVRAVGSLVDLGCHCTNRPVPLLGGRPILLHST